MFNIGLLVCAWSTKQSRLLRILRQKKDCSWKKTKRHLQAANNDNWKKEWAPSSPPSLSPFSPPPLSPAFSLCLSLLFLSLPISLSVLLSFLLTRGSIVVLYRTWTIVAPGSGRAQQFTMRLMSLFFKTQLLSFERQMHEYLLYNCIWIFEWRIDWCVYLIFVSSKSRDFFYRQDWRDCMYINFCFKETFSVYSEH